MPGLLHEIAPSWDEHTVAQGQVVALGRFLRCGSTIVLSSMQQLEDLTHLQLLQSLHISETPDDGGVYAVRIDPLTGRRILSFGLFTGAAPYSEEARSETVDIATQIVQQLPSPTTLTDIVGYDRRTDFKPNPDARIIRRCHLQNNNTSLTT